MAPGTVIGDFSVPVAGIITFLVSISAVGAVMFLKKRELVSTVVARKIMHISTGPAYCLTWLIFPEDAEIWGQVAASLSVIFITGFFCVIALGKVKSETVVSTMSRSGEAAELLRGPLFYGMVHVAATFFPLSWRESPVGIVSILVLCAGDGLADLAGRAFGGDRFVPWSDKKTYAGSIGFFVASMVAIAVIGGIYSGLGWWSQPYLTVLRDSLVVVLAGAFAESMTAGDYDNLTVYIATTVVGVLFWEI